MIDWDRAALLRAELGAEGFDEVAELFLEEVVALLAVIAERPERRSDDLHFLKGSAWNLGFAGLAEFCEAAELAGPAELDLADLRRVWDASRLEFLTGNCAQGGMFAA